VRESGADEPQNIAVRVVGCIVARIERLIETIIFQSRWVLAPFYLGLALSLLLLLFRFIRQLVELFMAIPFASEAEVILGVLGLIDLSFTGNLVVILIFSGYENFVSRIDSGADERPDWMTKVDFGGLKQKLAISIVAISAIQVLKAFMNIEHYDSSKLGWLVGIHVLFLGSLLTIALADRLTPVRE